uniref:Uncharacterized protein n=1 Tax=Rhizophora mucronata TaxID=61149 RepID=A0A2P2NAH3_RHIMU
MANTFQFDNLQELLMFDSVSQRQYNLTSKTSNSRPR